MGSNQQRLVIGLARSLIEGARTDSELIRQKGYAEGVVDGLADADAITEDERQSLHRQIARDAQDRATTLAGQRREALSGRPVLMGG